MARRTAPVRTCVGCRERAVAAELLRVVAVPGSAGLTVIPDPARRFSGRGASLHPDVECLALAERRRAFDRSLRVAGPLDLAPLREYVAEHDRRAVPQDSSTEGARQEQRDAGTSGQLSEHITEAGSPR